jgi:hypothetical protein
MHGFKAASVAVLPLFLLACRADAGPGVSDWSGTIDTLESGRLVIHNPDAGLWRQGEEWQLRERFRIGALEGDGADVLGDIRDLELGPAGEVYILDSQASEIRVFGSGGEHLRTFGRSGRGPGELSRPAGMALDSEETLWVMNWGNARYSGFDPGTGELKREVQRSASFAVIPWPGRFDAVDRLLDTGLGADGEPAILGLDSAFVPQDTLPILRADEAHQIVFQKGDVRVMMAMVPFAPQPSWAAHPDGGIVVGEGGAYRLHRIDFRGDTSVTIEVARAPVAVTRQERDSALAAFQEVGRMSGGEPDRRPRIPETKPAHGAIFVDDRGQLWVRRTDARGAAPAWDVLAADGRLLGQVAIPLSPGYVAPALRGDRLAIATMVDGVPTVVVYDVIRPAGAT